MIFVYNGNCTYNTFKNYRLKNILLYRHVLTHGERTKACMIYINTYNVKDVSFKMLCMNQKLYFFFGPRPTVVMLSLRMFATKQLRKTLNKHRYCFIQNHLN